MNAAEHPDPLLATLARLPARAPDAARATRTRARCHQTMARRSERLSPPVNLGLRLAWVLCALYFGDMLRVALAVYR